MDRDQAWTINDNDQLQSGAQYGPIIIAYRNGAPVRISDVATVIDGAENTKLAAWVNDDPAIVLNIQRQPGTNIISVVDTVQALLPQIKASLPEGIDVQVITRPHHHHPRIRRGRRIRADAHHRRWS